MAGKNTSVLNLDERKIIEECCLNNFTIGKIANLLLRAHSTIKAEVRKNGGKKKYNAIESQRLADLRQKSRIRKLNKSFTDEQVKHILSLANNGKSMTYIARELKVCLPTISNFLRQNNKAIPIRNYAHFIDRIETLETHIKMIYEILEEIKNDKKNK